MMLTLACYSSTNFPPGAHYSLERNKPQNPKKPTECRGGREREERGERERLCKERSGGKRRSKETCSTGTKMAILQREKLQTDPSRPFHLHTQTPC